MADINEVISLGLGSPANVKALILFGLQPREVAPTPVAPVGLLVIAAKPSGVLVELAKPQGILIPAAKPVGDIVET